MDRRRANCEGIFWYFRIRLFCLCAHPTITIREHRTRLDRLTENKQNILGQNHSFYRLFTFIGGIFRCHGSNLRLNWDIRAQFLLHVVVTKSPISAERFVHLT